MTAVTAITWMFALLLGVAGAQKLSRPAATGAALQVARLPSDTRFVRLLGVFEVLLAGAVLLRGGIVPAVLLAATYAAFAVFAFRQARRGAGCGCFGEATTPTTSAHVVLNVAAACTAAVAGVASAPPLVALGEDPLVLGVALGLLLTATALLRLTLTTVPELTAAQALLAPEAEA